MYQCFECNITYKYKRNLQRHLEERHFSTKKIFKCDICGRIFTRNSNLKRHFFNQHSLTEILDDLEEFPIETGLVVNSTMDYTINSAIYEDISSDEESFEEDLFLNKNNAEEFVSECEETSNIPTSEIPTPESPTLEIPTFESPTPEIPTSESPTPEIQTSEKKNSMTIQLIKKTVSYEDGRTEVMKEINFSYTEEMREVSPYEVFSNFLNDFMDES